MNRTFTQSTKIAMTFVIMLFLNGAVYGQMIQTSSEASGFSQYTSYDDMVEYLSTIQKTSKGIS